MINLLDLVEGTKLELTDGREVFVTENVGDGMWINVGDTPDGDWTLVHAQEIARVIES